MKKVLFVLAICSMCYAQKGEELSADKIVNIKETVIPEKTVKQLVTIDTLGNTELQDVVVPAHVLTEQARESRMLDLKDGDELLSVVTLNGEPICKLIYVVSKVFAGEKKSFVVKMDVR